MNDSLQARREQVLPVVERSERELRRALEDLQTALLRTVDVRHRIAERPLPWIIGGFLVGFWLGRRRADDEP